MELFAFQAGNEILGIPPQQVVRVVENAAITPVPLMPPCYLGLLAHRGELFDVIDVSCLLYLGTAVARSQPRIILTKWSSRRLALVPDRILGLVWPADNTGTPRQPPDPTQPPPTSGQPLKPTAPPRKLNLDALWESLEVQPYGPDPIL